MARMVMRCLIMGNRIGSVVGLVVVVSEVREVWMCSVGWVNLPIAREVSAWFDLGVSQVGLFGEEMYDGRTYTSLNAWYSSVIATAASSQWVFVKVTPPSQSTAIFALFPMCLAW